MTTANNNNAKNILFLCVANSARSQMAEGLARAMLPDHNIYSAGSAPTKPNPFAVQAMTEIGLDISAHTSDNVDDIETDKMDLIITLCADEVCPIVPNRVQRLHWPFSDPDSKGKPLSDIETIERFRNARNEIKSRLIREQADGTFS